jgi:hypothetical protein
MAKKNNKVEAVEPVSNPLDDARIKDLKRLEDFPSTGENLLQHALLMTHMQNGQAAVHALDQIHTQFVELNTKFAELMVFLMPTKVEGK